MHKKPTFHISVDDVLPSLISVSNNSQRLDEHIFFKTLKKASERYGIRTGLHLFYQDSFSSNLNNLKVVRNIEDEITDNWIYFGPHGLDNDTPPYTQSIEDQITSFELIETEIQRIAPEHKSKSIRLHHYSECYENSEYFLNNGITEIFTTDKLAGLYRLGSKECTTILNNGFITHNGLKLSRTHFRVENLANQNISKSDFLVQAEQIIKSHNRIIIYSHEYEHLRDEVNVMFLNVVKWLTEDLGLECEHP